MPCQPDDELCKMREEAMKEADMPDIDLIDVIKPDMSVPISLKPPDLDEEIPYIDVVPPPEQFDTITKVEDFVKDYWPLFVVALFAVYLIRKLNF